MSTLHVENLKGLSSGGNANKIIIPSGQTLDASNGFVAPAGHVIQVVHQPFSTSMNTSSTSFVTTGHSVTITPKSSSSKILISVQGGSWYNQAGNAYVTIYRGSSNLADTNGLVMQENQPYIPHSFVYYDSPSTTNATTYTSYIRVSVNTVTTYYSFPTYGKMGMTAMEIAQ
jgi:hypothetical protein